MECRTDRARPIPCGFSNYDPPCDDTIRKYMGQPKNQPDKPTNWLPFLRNRLDVSWAMDFFYRDHGRLLISLRFCRL